MEKADNGYVVTWEECTKPSQGGTYSGMSYQSKSAVFTKDQGAEAIAKMEELGGGESEEMDEPKMSKKKEMQEEKMEGEEPMENMSMGE